MARLQWTPCEQDAKEYELDGPQVFDPLTLNEQRSALLEAWEREMDVEIDDILFQRGNTRRVRATMWLTLKLAGRDIKFADFDPRVRLTEFASADGQEADADPPELSDADPSEPSPDSNSSQDGESTISSKRSARR